MMRHSTSDSRQSVAVIRRHPFCILHSALCIAAVAAFAATALADLDFSAFAHRATIDFDGCDWTSGAGSPLRNAGVAKPWMTGAKDLLGNPRKVERPDIGCYEYQVRTPSVLMLQ